MEVVITILCLLHRTWILANHSQKWTPMHLKTTVRRGNLWIIGKSFPLISQASKISFAFTFPMVMIRHSWKPPPSWSKFLLWRTQGDIWRKDLWVHHILDDLFHRDCGPPGGPNSTFSTILLSAKHVPVSRKLTEVLINSSPSPGYLRVCLVRLFSENSMVNTLLSLGNFVSSYKSFNVTLLGLFTEPFTSKKYASLSISGMPPGSRTKWYSLRVMGVSTSRSRIYYD